MLGALLITALAAYAAAPEAPVEPTLVEIEFRGLETQSAESVRKLLSAQEWAPYSQAEESADKEALENSGLFSSVSVKRTTLSASRFRLEISVKEARAKKPGVFARVFGKKKEAAAVETPPASDAAKTSVPAYAAQEISAAPPSGQEQPLKKSEAENSLEMEGREPKPGFFSRWKQAWKNRPKKQIQAAAVPEKAEPSRYAKALTKITTGDPAAQAPPDPIVLAKAALKPVAPAPKPPAPAPSRLPSERIFTPAKAQPEPERKPLPEYEEPDPEAPAHPDAAYYQDQQEEPPYEENEPGVQERNDPGALPSSYEPLISQSLQEAQTPAPKEGAEKEPFLSRAPPTPQSAPVLEGFDAVFAPLKIAIDRLREKIMGPGGLSERIVKERDRSAPDSALRVVSMQLLRVNQDFLDDALDDVENADEARGKAETLMLEGLRRHRDRLALFRASLTRSAEEIYASTPVDPRPAFNDARKALNEAGETIERVRRAVEDASADLARGRRAVSEADRTIAEAQRLNAESFSELLKEGPTIGELGEDLVALQREVLLEAARLQSMAQWQSVTREGDARQRERALRELAAAHEAAGALLEKASAEWDLGRWEQSRLQIAALQRTLKEMAVAELGLVKPLSNR